MCVLSSKEILKRNIITPVLTTKHDDHVIPSYGLDGCLYTFRCKYRNRYWVMSQHTSVSLASIEDVTMPRDVMAVSYLKSTYSRQGLILCNGGVIDPGYTGNISVVLFNGGLGPVTLDLYGGIFQCVFHRLTESTDMPYQGRHQQ